MTSKKEEILRLRAEGLSYKQIRAETGASLATISFHCSPGQKEKNAARTRDRRNKICAYLQEIKEASGCVDCGEKYPYFTLDFDHVRGDKLGTIAYMTRGSTLEEVKAEVAKCDIVCSNCHRFRTWNRIVSSGGSTLELATE